ncbi:MAG: histidinol-phosphate transaminase [Chloroflexi bacterium]|nr:histidinol-phosphate transaminase [Chloroflexota bacterium]
MGGTAGPTPDDVRRLLRPQLRAVEPYAAIESVRQVAARYGLDPERLVKLDGNENPEGASPAARRALGAVTPHRYPDPEQRRLREALAAHLGVAPESVVAGAGSDELIDLVIRCVVGPGDRVVIAPPTFGMYAFDAGQVGAEVVEVPRLPDWSLDPEALLAEARRAKLVALASPNNPTGGSAPRELLESLLESGALLLLDEAYIEFTKERSMAEEAAAGAPLVVLRTFSKWGGLAGMRVGYAAMPAPLAETLMVVKQPYSVSVAAEAAALASLEDRALLDERACALVAERERMAAALAETGWLHPHPSAANFVLVEATAAPAGGPPPADAGRRLYEALRRRGVLVRHFASPRLGRCVRISAGRAGETDALLAAIDEAAASGELGGTEGGR